MIQQVL